MIKKFNLIDKFTIDAWEPREKYFKYIFPMIKSSGRSQLPPVTRRKYIHKFFISFPAT